MKKFVMALIVIVAITNFTGVTTFAAETPTTMFVTTAQAYNNDWYENDRKAFAKEVNGIIEGSVDASVVYDEYVFLNNELAAVDAKAYHGKRGYILYSPALTDETNNLRLAITARSNVLAAIKAGTLNTSEIYYPEKKYSIIRYDMFKISQRIDGIVKEVPLEVTHTQSFDTYDEKRIAQALDRLEISDFFLYGNRIYFVNGVTNTTLLGFNLLTSVRGAYDDHIVIFNKAKTTEELISTVLHEVGHSVGREIFSIYSGNGSYSVNNNIDIMNAYASIYGKANYSNDANVSWASSLQENFAEDFMQIYSNRPKHTNWSGNHKSEVRAFVQENLKKIDLSKTPIFTELQVQTKNAKYLFVDDYLNGTNAIYTKENTVVIRLVGGKNAGVALGASLFSLDNNGNPKAYVESCVFNDKEEATITIPKNGIYSIYVGEMKQSGSMNYVGGNILSHFKLIKLS